MFPREKEADAADQVEGALPALRARVWVALAGLYVAQAIPLNLVAAALPPILRARGVDLAVIGGLGILMLPWVLKAFWAPYVDRLSWNSKIRRKGVIFVTQIIAIGLIVGLAMLDPVADIQSFFPILFAL